MSILLSHTQKVTARANGDPQHLWLSLQFEVEALPRPAVLIQNEPATSEHDLSFCVATTPEETHQSIERCRHALGGSGIIALLVRRPYDQWLDRWLEQEEIKVITSYRGVDHWLIPEGLCADYPGDLILLQCPPGKISAPPAGRRQNMVDQPAIIIDIHQLNEKRVNPESLTELADMLDGLSPHPETHRAIQISEDLWTLSWYDEHSSGLTLELRPQERHVFATLMPFERGLERAFIHAALLTWADTHTRLEPVRTYWCGGESVFA